MSRRQRVHTGVVPACEQHCSGGSCSSLSKEQLCSDTAHVPSQGRRPCLCWVMAYSTSCLPKEHWDQALEHVSFHDRAHHCPWNTNPRRDCSVASQLSDVSGLNHLYQFCPAVFNSKNELISEEQYWTYCSDYFEADFMRVRCWVRMNWVVWAGAASEKWTELKLVPHLSLSYKSNYTAGSAE